MQKLRWQLISNENYLIRYCPHCQKKAKFTNSTKVRRNANSKNIHEFFIYKCEKDHTWNKKFSPDDKKNQTTQSAPRHQEEMIEKIDWLAYGAKEEIEILLEDVVGKWRLDKLLAAQLKGVTRSTVKVMIKSGQILLNGQETQGKKCVKAGDTIFLKKASQLLTIQ